MVNSHSTVRQPAALARPQRAVFGVIPKLPTPFWAVKNRDQVSVWNYDDIATTFPRLTEATWLLVRVLFGPPLTSMT